MLVELKKCLNLFLKLLCVYAILIFIFAYLDIKFGVKKNVQKVWKNKKNVIMKLSYFMVIIKLFNIFSWLWRKKKKKIEISV